MTWAREKALECASRAYPSAPIDDIIGAAQYFEEWLTREDDPVANEDANAEQFAEGVAWEHQRIWEGLSKIPAYRNSLIHDDEPSDAFVARTVRDLVGNLGAERPTQ